MSEKFPRSCKTPICAVCDMGPCINQVSDFRCDAEFAPGVGWMAVTKTGRYGNFETEAQALRAAIKAVEEGK